MKTRGAIACSLLLTASAVAADSSAAPPRQVTLGGIIHSDTDRYPGIYSRRQYGLLRSEYRQA
jgi:hypothetical protein